MLQAARADKTKPFREEHFLLSVIWKNPEYIDAYLSEQGLSLARGTVRALEKWRKHYVAGPFFVERFTKNGAVFISTQTGQVYLVRGVTSDIEESVDKNALPLMVETALLPYKGNLVYDGMMQAFPDALDAEGKKAITKIYEYAKEHDHIIRVLPPPNPAQDDVQLEQMLRAIMPLLPKEPKEGLSRKLNDDPEVHLIPDADLATIRKLLKKMRRSQKDWDKIQEILFSGDVITAEPMFESGDLKGVEHVLCQDEVLYVFTTAEKCQSYLRYLNKDDEAHRFFQIVTLSYEAAIRIADDYHKQIFVDFHPDTRFDKILVYDSRTSRLTASILL